MENDGTEPPKDSNVVNIKDYKNKVTSDDGVGGEMISDSILMQPIAFYTLEDGRKLVISEQVQQPNDGGDEKLPNQIRENFLDMIGTDEQSDALAVYERDIGSFITHMVKAYHLADVTYKDIEDVIDDITKDFFKVFQIADEKRKMKEDG